MNVCWPYAAAFGLLALLASRRDPAGARGLWGMTAALLALGVAVSLSPLWPLVGMTVWLLVAVDLHKLSAHGKFSHRVPALGYALAGSYSVHVLGAFRLWGGPWGMAPTWISAAIGIALGALLFGPTARELRTALSDRLRERIRLGRGAVARRGLGFDLDRRGRAASLATGAKGPR